MTYGKQGVQIIKVTCVENGITIDAELFESSPTRLTVILPSFQKLTLTRSPTKPNVWIANKFGLEFHATYIR